MNQIGEGPGVLAVETSSRMGSIAVGRGGEMLVERTFTQKRPGRDHLAELLPAVDAELNRLGWRPADIRHVYVSSGPGSFTGLRIAITFARSLAQATGARIVLVPSAVALADNAPADVMNVAIVLDAKRGQVYTAVFSRRQPGGPMETVVPVALMAPGEMLAIAPRPLHLLGEGIDYHRNDLKADGVIELPRELWTPRASAVYRIGRAMAREGKFTDPQDAVPIYIRRPEAEEQWDRRHGKASNGAP